MKKPTIEDLSRIKNELEEMREYFLNFTYPDHQVLTDSEIDIFDMLTNCSDYCLDIIRIIPDLREGVIDDC